MNTRTTALRERNKKLAIRGLLYVSAVFVCFLLYADPNLSLFGIKPNLLVPLTVCAAMLDGVFAGAMVGTAAGLLTDMVRVSPFGTNALLFAVLAVAVGLLCMLLLRPVVVNALLLTLGASACYYVLDFLLLYAEAGYEWPVFAARYSAPLLVTAALAAAFYYPVRAAARRLRFVV